MRNALARVAARAGAGLLEVQLPIEVLRRGPKAVHAAFREALSQHRCARGLRSGSDVHARAKQTLPWLCCSRWCASCGRASPRWADHMGCRHEWLSKAVLGAVSGGE